MIRLILRTALATSALVAVAVPASADETDARTLLKAMSDYLAAQTELSFTYDTDVEILTPDVQKLAIASSGTLSLARPDKVVATRTGGFADVALYFDGKTLTLQAKTVNLYGQKEMPGTVDQLVDSLRGELGRPLPGADLLSGDVNALLTGGLLDLKDLGSGVINGVECDHLAGRTAEVDWQIWIRQGDTPYPCRYVVTSKLMAAAPEYRIDITGWKTGADASASFSFENTTGAEMADLGKLPDMDDVPDIFMAGGGQ